MITTNPFRRLLAEKGLSVNTVSQLTNIPSDDIYKFLNNKKITPHKVEALCRILDCQPCDLIEFTQSETKGHWEWIADSKK